MGVTFNYMDVLDPFTRMMLEELRANSSKGDRPGWLSMSKEQAVLEIYYHTAKLQRAVYNREPEKIREFAADVANHAMMVADICGVLPA